MAYVTTSLAHRADDAGPVAVGVVVVGLAVVAQDTVWKLHLARPSLHAAVPVFSVPPQNQSPGLQ